MGVTIKDIALQAGVSASTVSRVLNRSGYVSQPVRDRIERAVEDLQYEPSWVARSLRGKHSYLIGLIIPDILNVYYTGIAKSILENLAAHGYNLLIQISNEDPNLDLSYLRMLYDRKVDGIIHVPVARGDNSDYLRDLVAKGMPVVELNRQMLPDLVDAVLADNFEGAHTATEYLLKLGHQRIALINGSTQLTTGRNRLGGYKKALEDSGVAFDAALVKASEFTKAWGRTGAREVLELRPRPTAIFAGSNRILMGVMSVLAEQGLRVPDDMSVIAFDDSEWLSFWQPPITTVDIAVEEMALLAVQLLLRRMREGKPVEKPVTYQLSVNLVERQSCRKIPTQQGGTREAWTEC